MSAVFPILWLTGNSGAGKTTLAYGVKRYFDEEESEKLLYRKVVILDGDEMRASISTTETLSPADRRAHNLRVARLASVLQSQGFLVIVSVIAPFISVREEIDVLCQPKWIYVQRSGLDAPNRPYEPPEEPDYTICIDNVSKKEGIEEFLRYIPEATIIKQSHALPVGMTV